MKIPDHETVDDESNRFKEEKNNSNHIFQEYMWMENEEEFDKEVMKQLEEEALMEQCIEAMLEDELENKVPLDGGSFISEFEKLALHEKVEIARKSTLNPDAAEFVPKNSV
ncbi:polyadenylate-binding protein-interacting protein 2B [Halyomorpha halys]|uniref:Ataxin-2 C-terminal domain-containing protein n=1 Tax=Nezara viridula TaxID=85310 RepID=A0A9P0H3U5_NEZVI|nr:polyadenylate-binding protein-interacting protein 2B-like [Halyomorpha halys]CAH1393285.1 unnamed protein product [Nezara viridula]